MALSGNKFGLLIGLLLAIAIAFFPLRLVFVVADAEQHGVSARAVEGTIWNGSVRDLRLGALNIGDLDMGARFWSIFVGRLSLDLYDTNKERASTGNVQLSSGSYKIENLDIEVTANAAGIGNLVKTIEFQNLSANVTDEKCKQASGQLRLTIGPNPLGLNLKNGLLGSASCKDDALFFLLKSQSATEEVHLSLTANGGYNGKLIINKNSLQDARLLSQLGFEASGENLERSFSGSF